MHRSDSARSRPGSTRTPPISGCRSGSGAGTPPSSRTPSTCPSRNASCPWVANAPVHGLARVRQPQREQLHLRAFAPAQLTQRSAKSTSASRPAGASAAERLHPGPGLGRGLGTAAGHVLATPSNYDTAAPCSSTSRATPAARYAAAYAAQSRSARSTASITRLTPPDAATRDRQPSAPAGSRIQRLPHRPPVHMMPVRQLPDRQPSTRSSRRIAANNSTLDPVPPLP